MPRITAVLAATVAAIALPGCGGSAPSPPSSTTVSAGGASTSTSARATTTRHPRPRRRRRPRHRAGAPIGAAQTVHAGATTLSVTVTRLLDPLTDTGMAPAPGTRAVGVQLTILDRSGATYDSTASGDVAVMTASGPASPLFIRQGACQTPLTDFESLIGVGASRSGCVGFSVPRGARVVSVRFSPHARAAGSVSWR